MVLSLIQGAEHQLYLSLLQYFNMYTWKITKCVNRLAVDARRKRERKLRLYPAVYRKYAGGVVGYLPVMQREDPWGGLQGFPPPGKRSWSYRLETLSSLVDRRGRPESCRPGWATEGRAGRGGGAGRGGRGGGRPRQGGCWRGVSRSATAGLLKRCQCWRPFGLLPHYGPPGKAHRRPSFLPKAV